MNIAMTLMTHLLSFKLNSIRSYAAISTTNGERNIIQKLRRECKIKIEKFFSLQSDPTSSWFLKLTVVFTLGMMIGDLCLEISELFISAISATRNLVQVLTALVAVLMLWNLRKDFIINLRLPR